MLFRSPRSWRAGGPIHVALDRAWGVGLLVWNEQICAAWRAKPPRQTRRKQELRPSVEFGRLECAAAEAAVTAAPIPSVGTPPAADDLGSDVLASPLTPVAAGSAASVEPEITTLMAPQSAEPEPFESAERPSVALNTSAPGELPLPAPTATNVSATAATSPLMSTLAGIMSRAYANLGDSGWHIDPQACLVVCPEGQRLKPYNLTSPRSGLPRLSVRSDANACVGCVRRETCFPADRTGAYKQVTRSIPVEETEACAAAIEEMRAKRPARRRLTRRTAPARRTAPTPRAVPRPDLPGPWYAPPERTPPGPWWAERPQFVPTEARRRTRTLPPHFVVRVEIGDVIPIAKPSAHIAQDRARRARRRRTYVEMEARNRLPARTLVKVTVEPRESRAGSTKS